MAGAASSGAAAKARGSLLLRHSDSVQWLLSLVADPTWPLRSRTRLVWPLEPREEVVSRPGRSYATGAVSDQRGTILPASGADRVRMSVDGPRQNHQDRSEGPWGRAVCAARMAELNLVPYPTERRSGMQR